MADAASAVLGSRGEGVGVGPVPAVGSGAPVAPAGGRARKGEQTPAPAEAPAPPLQLLPPHSPARAFLFRSPSVPVSMVTASGRSPRLRPLGGLPAPLPRTAQAPWG